VGLEAQFSIAVPSAPASPLPSMPFPTLRLFFANLLLTLLLSSCGGGSSAPPPAGGITVVPGDGIVTISWTADPGVEYWLLYAPATSVSTKNLIGPHAWATNVTSPYVLTGLVNGVTYAFTLDGRVNGGPGGAGTPSVAVVPRPAGATWTAGSGSGSSDLRGLTYGIATDPATAIGTYNFLAAGKAPGAGQPGALFKGTDGVNWTAITTGPVADFNAAIYTLSKYLVLGSGGTIAYSTDLSTWTASSSNTTQTLNAVSGNGALTVAVGNAGTILYSADGITWTAAAAVPTTQDLRGVTYYGGGLWMAVGTNGTILTSTDAINWTAATSGSTSNLNGVIATSYSSTVRYIAIGDSGVVLTSPDATTWTSQVLGSGNLYDVAQVSSQFLIVGAAGSAFTSPYTDGVVWTARTTGTAADLYAAIGAIYKYIVVGQAGVNINSQ